MSWSELKWWMPFFVSLSVYEFACVREWVSETGASVSFDFLLYFSKRMLIFYAMLFVFTFMLPQPPPQPSPTNEPNKPILPVGYQLQSVGTQLPGCTTARRVTTTRAIRWTRSWTICRRSSTRITYWAETVSRYKEMDLMTIRPLINSETDSNNPSAEEKVSPVVFNLARWHWGGWTDSNGVDDDGRGVLKIVIWQAQKELCKNHWCM